MNAHKWSKNCWNFYSKTRQIDRKFFKKKKEIHFKCNLQNNKKKLYYIKIKILSESNSRMKFKYI